MAAPRFFLFLLGVLVGVLGIGLLRVISQPTPVAPANEPVDAEEKPQRYLWQTLAEVSQQLKSSPEIAWENDSTEFGYESLDFAIEARRVAVADNDYIFYLRPIPAFTRPQSKTRRGNEGTFYWTIPQSALSEHPESLKFLPGHGRDGPNWDPPRMTKDEFLRLLREDEKRRSK